MVLEENSLLATLARGIEEIRFDNATIESDNAVIKSEVDQEIRDCRRLQDVEQTL